MVEIEDAAAPFIESRLYERKLTYGSDWRCISTQQLGGELAARVNRIQAYTYAEDEPHRPYNMIASTNEALSEHRVKLVQRTNRMTWNEAWDWRSGRNFGISIG
jgi:hypothetical protein